MRLKSLATNTYLHLAVLALVVLLVFNRTLGSYFLADDFGEVAYVSRIASGDLGMLWANFSGNYMQIASMSVWRPWLLISLLIDFMLWGAKPFGFYLTNLLSYMGVCIALYLFVRNLCRDWCTTRAGLAAFFAALLFAVNPLHCESVSWVVGRVDIICALFYLVCLNLFIMSMRAEGKRRKNLTILSVVAFWLAMWTKEMAIGAPVMAFAIAMLWGEPPLALKKGLRLCAPLIVSTVVYFILRFICLGTVLGGYTQGIGDAQAAAALNHWLDADTARRLFMPLAYSLYGDHHIYQTAFSLLYTLLTALLLLRLLSLSAPLRWVLLLPVWLLTALAPIYKLWGLGYELEGARFVFFVTMPLAVLFPIFLFAPHAPGTAPRDISQRFYRWAFAALSTIGLVGLAALNLKVASALNLEWVHAGKEVRQFAEQSKILAGQATTGDIIVLGIPKRRGGAHMVLNGTTFKILLAHPFVEEKLPLDHLLTFDPIIFGNADYINAQRFKSSLSKQGTRVMLWDGEKGSFKNIALAQSHNQGPLPTLPLPTTPPPCFLHAFGHALIEDNNGKAAISHITAGDGIYFDNLTLSPLDADIVEVDLTCLEAPADRPVALDCLWKEKGEQKEDDDARQNMASKNFLAHAPERQKLYLRLSQNFHWYTHDNIGALCLNLPPQTKLMVHSIKLMRAEEISPRIEISTGGQAPLSATPIGVYPVESGAKMTVKVALPASLQKGQVLLEISKPNAFFENFSESDQSKAVETTLKKDCAGEVVFDLPPQPVGANYQVRARVLDAKGLSIGESSDPLVLRVQ